MSQWNKRKAGPSSNGGGGSWKQKQGSPASSAEVKKSRPNLDDEDMEMMDTEEQDLEMAFMEMGDSEMTDDEAGLIGQEDDTAKSITYSEWERPAVDKDFSPNKSSLIFQQIDVDHYLDKPLAGMPGARLGPVPVLRCDCQYHVGLIFMRKLSVLNQVEVTKENFE